MLTDDSAGADMFAEGCRDETNGRSYSTIVHDTETYLLCANCGAVVSVETAEEGMFAEIAADYHWMCEYPAFVQGEAVYYRVGSDGVCNRFHKAGDGSFATWEYGAVLYSVNVGVGYYAVPGAGGPTPTDISPGPVSTSRSTATTGRTRLCLPLSPRPRRLPSPVSRRAPP